MIENDKKSFFQVENMCVGYNNKPLISEINIKLERGEILTLIGPNGSGKSTILKSITGHLQKISGDVFLCGKSMDEIERKEKATKISVVLTERITPELMTVFDIVASARYPYTNSFGMLTACDKEIVWECIEKVRISDICDKDFLRISDGQRQKVMLARAICQQPEIIILDEPTSFLDIKHKIELLNILSQMAKEKNIAVIMSLHEIDIASKISDYIALIKGDKIEKFGTPDEIFTGDTIKNLYDLKSGSYNHTFGSVELAKPSGNADVFVYCSAGSGVSAFRHLQKAGIAFSCGVLWENESAFEVATALACEIASVSAFSKLTDLDIEKAKKMVDSCGYFLDTSPEIGEINNGVCELLRYAKASGKRIVSDISEIK
ncbi:MAG: ABC transporter ATP-binding protein [Bacillota bacterium]